MCNWKRNTDHSRGPPQATARKGDREPEALKARYGDGGRPGANGAGVEIPPRHLPAGEWGSLAGASPEPERTTLSLAVARESNAH